MYQKGAVLKGSDYYLTGQQPHNKATRVPQDKLFQTFFTLKIKILISLEQL